MTKFVADNVSEIVKQLCHSYLPCVHSAMEQCALKSVNNCLNANIYSYLETSGGKS